MAEGADYSVDGGGRELDDGLRGIERVACDTKPGLKQDASVHDVYKGSMSMSAVCT